MNSKRYPSQQIVTALTARRRTIEAHWLPTVLHIVYSSINHLRIKLVAAFADVSRIASYEQTSGFANADRTRSFSNLATADAFGENLGENRLLQTEMSLIL